jgi:hypothetical protein
MEGIESKNWANKTIRLCFKPSRKKGGKRTSLYSTQYILLYKLQMKPEKNKKRIPSTTIDIAVPDQAIVHKQVNRRGKKKERNGENSLAWKKKTKIK